MITIIVVVALVFAICFVVVAIIGCWIVKARRQENHIEDNDVNPTYGDYADYSEPVVEVDSNPYYSEVYTEGTSRVKDNNSLYNE